MTDEQKMVLEFHRKFALTVAKSPSLPSEKDYHLRIELIHEEERELYHADTLVAVADALADLLYVVNGTAVTFGIDLQPIVIEVHRSNMSKLWTHAERATYGKGDLTFTHMGSSLESMEIRLRGRHWLAKNDAGKVVKSPSYSPADIAKELRLQGYAE
jgi:hypothetical protein